MKETIYALSSGSVPSGVAVIRISGPAVRKVVSSLCRKIPTHRQTQLSKLRDPQTREVLDEALVLYFQGPNSFTGEDVAEIHCHGGRAVVAAVLNSLAQFEACRPAEPGEFTRRAFDGGRMDLTEVEGLADLIASETESQRRQAVRQMGGALGKLYDDWRKRLIHMRAMIEADFDFADEEDVPGSVADKVWAEAGELKAEIEDHLVRSKSGERLRSGVQVVLMGAPNAGKSSLLNAIAGRDVAIVTEEAGTTRDVIEVHLDLVGYPVTLVDTAGLRKAEGVVEQEGIRRAEQRGREADLILWAVEPDGIESTDKDGGLPADLSTEVPVWTVRTKADLETPPKQDSSGTTIDIPASSKDRNGVRALFEALTCFAKETISVSEVPLATRSRHRHYLNDCLTNLEKAVTADHLPAELRAEDLRRAADDLGRITGRIDVEDLLDVIFRDFCIGK
ncbi:tRNA uridine-5-carboxymethylaminomethyl(34) synthesis GTPase MnmE [Roseibium denhamense]|uniref:tRNA modification GTPase MnmE n=1 Tax=Roseibium denhamense TaxID=76305 RepID=A0ABY1PBJ4_9HYPH|nr:tRNA uridine-5-carboxymethylaminomethyl(34) synthesis GTPase MnmE [Roseibium denhamense]MTI05271.1 tRNA uridine-5-carboxymethylaminomethyl(34) synthesis GTPase MnmE [Roseibium denhamense]SMP30571.1 tRNA modification GTPase trmE [Roseibium denhamense]